MDVPQLRNRERLLHEQSDHSVFLWPPDHMHGLHRQSEVGSEEAVTRRYYEDFEIGQVFVTASRTITDVQVAQWAALSGDFNELHMSETYARQSPFGRRIAHGPVGLAVASGMGNSLWEEGGRAALSLSWQFKAPIAIGDTIHCEVEVLRKQPTRSRRGGSADFAVRVINQNDEVVQTGEKSLLFYPRPDIDATASNAVGEKE